MPQVNNVRTENGKTYVFLFCYTVVDDDEPGNIGMSQLRVYEPDANDDIGMLLLNIDGISEDKDESSQKE